jgi:hypothetical protein
MHCGISWRTPSRRTVLAYTGRLALLACLLVLAFGPAAQPASAYVCGRPSKDARTLQAHVGVQKDCDRPTGRVERGNADPMSFIFFIGILLAVVLVPVAVPVALARREELSPE